MAAAISATVASPNFRFWCAAAQNVASAEPTNLVAGRGPVFFTVLTRTGERIDARNAPVLRRHIALDLRDASVADALDSITAHSSLNISYSRTLIASSGVTLRASDITVSAALSAVLLDAGLDVELTGPNRATLIPRAGLPPLRVKRADQDARITGRVIDYATRQPVAAAAVTVTGTTIGQNTTDSGTFSVRLPPDAKSLTVRRIGYLAQIVALVAGETDYTVQLQPDVLRLEAQVVNGVVTTVASRNSANAVAVVNADQVNEVPEPTVENSLQGKIPGALIQSNNGGAPGGGVQVQIRGVTSIFGNAFPLYVVDGVIVNNETVDDDEQAINQSYPGSSAPNNSDNGVNRIADISSEDIESIQVLKGASAAAIYGSKASAGVILITTKKGTTGRPRWTASQQVGHYAMSNEYPIRTFGSLASAQAWYNQDVIAAATPAQVASDNAYVASIYAGPQNYQRQLFGSQQLSYQTDISVSGTSGPTQYFLSGLSKYDNGIMLNTGYNKQSIRSNVTQQFSSALSATVNLNYVHSVTKRGITGNDNIGISPYDVFSYTPGFVALNRVNADGTWPINPFGPANPFADAIAISTPQEVSRFIGGGTINWALWKAEHQSIRFNAVGGADVASLQDLLYAPPTLQVEQRIPSGLPGAAVSNTAQIKYFNYSLNLIHDFTGLRWLDATTSAGFERDRRSNVNPVAIGYKLLAGVTVPTGGTVQNNFFYATKQLDQSVYIQEQVLALDSRLGATAGVAAERSTNDGDVGRFYFYPHYAASYQLPTFVRFIDNFKLRAAYGQSGNLPLFGAKFTALPAAFLAGQPGIAPTETLGDSHMRPESEVETEVGFDATMFQSRGQFTATIYRKRLTSLVLASGVAPSHGFASEYVNNGEFTNEGVELSLQMTPVRLRNGFSWVSTATVYRNYSVVNALPTPPFTVSGSLLAVGRSVSEIANCSFTNANGSCVQIGDGYPGISTTFGNEFTWKGFRISGFLEWADGGNTFDWGDIYYDFGPALYADSAYRANQNRKIARGLEPWLQPYGFLKVRELSLSYTAPKSIVDRIPFGGVTSVRVSLTGHNLWGMFHYDGLDPETTTNNGLQIRSQGEITPYPPARSFYLGLDLGL